MNATQRKELANLAAQIDTIKEQLESIRDAEQEKYDNMPEGLQESERGEKFQEGIDTLDEIISNLEEAAESFGSFEE